MTPEILLLVLGALGISGLTSGWWWTRRALRQHVIQVQTAWVRAGQIVHYGPVGTVCLGNRPRHAYRGGSFVVAGAPDAKLADGGIKVVIVNDAYYFAIDELSRAFPGVLFIRADEANDKLGLLVK